MSVRVELPLAGASDAVIAPRESLDLSSDPPRVHLGGDRWREIEAGPCSAQWCAVRGDLEPGTRVAPRRSTG
jgi:hypothetical protein